MGTRYDKMHKTVAILCLLSIIAIPTIALGGFFTVLLPRGTEYNSLFGSDIALAKKYSTFEGMELQIVKVRETMGRVFAKMDYSKTYGSHWYFNQIPSKTLKAQDEYFIYLLARIEQYQATFNRLKNENVSTAYLSDWYSQAIKNMRLEMMDDRESDKMDFMLYGAWVYNFATDAYWTQFWMTIDTILILPFTAICLLALYIWMDENKRSWQRKYEEKHRVK